MKATGPAEPQDGDLGSRLHPHDPPHLLWFQQRHRGRLFQLPCGHKEHTRDRKPEEMALERWLPAHSWRQGTAPIQASRAHK